MLSWLSCTFAEVKISILNETLELFPQKALLWHRNRILVVADAHLGKVGHFRKNGIAVPAQAERHNLEALVQLIQFTRPTRVIFLGDLFHSGFNYSWEAVAQLTNHFKPVSFELVEGNHDVLEEVHYRQSGLKVHGARLDDAPFVFTHHPLEQVPEHRYNISGHLHPGIMLYGKGKQGVRVPCFYFSVNRAVFPAFGAFTGLSAIQPRKEDRIFVIVEHEVIEVPAHG